MVNNRRRSRRDTGRRLGRLRSEKVERSFAHLSDTGGAIRSWLCGLEKINERHAMQAAAHNLSVLMRTAFGIGKPRGLADRWAAACAALLALLRGWRRLFSNERSSLDSPASRMREKASDERYQAEHQLLPSDARHHRELGDRYEKEAELVRREIKKFEQTRVELAQRREQIEARMREV